MGFFERLFSSEQIEPREPQQVQNTQVPSHADSLEQAELTRQRQELSDHLSENGINGLSAPCLEDVASMSPEEVASAKKALASFRRKVDHYLELGADPDLLSDSDFNQAIERAEYLSSAGCLDRQWEFFGLDYSDMIKILDKEEQDLDRMRGSQDKPHAGALTSASSASAGIEFEHLCRSLLDKMGFETETTKASGDGGIDIMATNRQPLVAGKYVIQCKRYTGSVGEPVIRDLYGVVSSERANKGILMTTGTFTSSARSFAEGKQLELIDGKGIDALLEQYGLSGSVGGATQPVNDASLSDFLGNYYCDYKEAGDESDSVIRICKQVDALFGGIQMKIAHGEGRIEQVHSAVGVLDGLVEKLISTASVQSRSGRAIYYLAWLIRAQYSVWTCNFAKAAACYLKVADEWKDIQFDDFDDPSLDTAWLAISAISMLNIIGIPVQSERVRLDHRTWINVLAESVSSPDPFGITLDFMSEYKSSVKAITGNVRRAQTIVALSARGVGEATDLVSAADPSRRTQDGLNHGFNTIDVDSASDAARIVAGFGNKPNDSEPIPITTRFEAVRAREEAKYRRGADYALESPLDLIEDCAPAIPVEGKVEGNTGQEIGDISDIVGYYDSLKSIFRKLNHMNSDGSLVFGMDDEELCEDFDVQLFQYCLWVIGEDTRVTIEDARAINLLTNLGLTTDGISSMKEGGKREAVTSDFGDVLPSLPVAMKQAFDAVGADDPSERLADLFEMAGKVLVLSGGESQTSRRLARVDAYCSKMRDELPLA